MRQLRDALVAVAIFLAVFAAIVGPAVGFLWLAAHGPPWLRRAAGLLAFVGLGLLSAGAAGGVRGVVRKGIAFAQAHALVYALHAAFVAGAAAFGWLVRETVVPERQQAVIDGVAFAAFVVLTPLYLVVMFLPDAGRPAWLRRVRGVLLLAPYAAVDVSGPDATADQERGASG